MTVRQILREEPDPEGLPMDTRLTAEQDEIRRSLRELLHVRCGSAEVRAAVDTPAGYDPLLWAELADRHDRTRLAVRAAGELRGDA